MSQLRRLPQFLEKKPCYLMLTLPVSQIYLARKYTNMMRTQCPTIGYTLFVTKQIKFTKRHPTQSSFYRHKDASSLAAFTFITGIYWLLSHEVNKNRRNVSSINKLAKQLLPNKVSVCKVAIKTNKFIGIN